MTGGAGNDVYLVQNAGITVIENPGEGTDIVTSDVDFALPTNVEHMFLLGFGNITGTGNNVQNVLVGNLGINTLIGKQGNDIYFVQTAGATIIENVGEGLDTLFNYVTMTLDAEVEDMRMQGTSNIDGTGNSMNNVLTGNSGDNVLNGKAGNDTLIGGAGADKFAFNTVLNAGTNVDTIADFQAGDAIQLYQTIFTSLTPGSLAAGNFVAAAGATAQEADDFILYDTATGNLYYDQDGIGGTAATQFASLTGQPALSHANLVVV